MKNIDKFQNDVAELRVALSSIRSAVQSLKRRRLLRKFDPDQPRVPAGDPEGGRWTDGSEASTDMSSPSIEDDEKPQFAARRLSPAQERFCEEQYRRDTFHCSMVGLRSCYAQASLRYSNCLAGRPIPPLNY